MTIAAATAARMMRVPIRKMRPRTRSLISLAATSPTSPRESSTPDQPYLRIPVFSGRGAPLVIAATSSTAAPAGSRTLVGSCAS